MSSSSRLRLPTFRLGWQAIVLTASKIGILLMHLRFSGSLLLLAGFVLYYFTFPERMAEQQLLQANADSLAFVQTPVTDLVFAAEIAIETALLFLLARPWSREILGFNRAARSPASGFMDIARVGVATVILDAPLILLMSASLFANQDNSPSWAVALVVLAAILGWIWLVRYWLVVPALAIGNNNIHAAGELGRGRRVSLIVGIIVACIPAILLQIAWLTFVEIGPGSDMLANSQITGSLLSAIITLTYSAGAAALCLTFMALAYRYLTDYAAAAR